MTSKKRQIKLAEQIMEEDREVLSELATIIEDNQWIDAIDGYYGVCAPSAFRSTPVTDVSVHDKIDALASLSQGEYYLDTLGFIAGLMLEIDGGLTGTNLTREIKHDRLVISVKFGKRN